MGFGSLAEERKAHRRPLVALLQVALQTSMAECRSGKVSVRAPCVILRLSAVGIEVDRKPFCEHDFPLIVVGSLFQSTFGGHAYFVHKHQI